VYRILWRSVKVCGNYKRIKNVDIFIGIPCSLCLYGIGNLFAKTIAKLFTKFSDVSAPTAAILSLALASRKLWFCGRLRLVIAFSTSHFQPINFISARLLRAGIVFGCACLCVCLSVCLSVLTKSWKSLIGNWCNLVGIWTMVKGGWKFVKFDFNLLRWELFSYLFNL